MYLKEVEKLIYSSTMSKECVKCEGVFQRNEQVYIDVYNQSYCEACYKETYNQ